MEDNIQTIIVVVISVFLLFIFPVYMAYEKKDDISYALAMRYTQDLVDEVRNKGYITKYMYEDYRAKLKVTGNTYDIQMKHEYNRYDPITKYFSVTKVGEEYKYTLVKTTTHEEKTAWYAELEQQGRRDRRLNENSSKEEVQAYIADILKVQYGINKVEETYELSTQTYTTNHILNVLNSQKKLLLNSTEETVNCDDTSETNKCEYAYTMNVDDIFNVTIKNTNVTLATVVYNMVTANVMDKNTRIYVNYGGTILSNKWYGNIDYSKLERTVSLNNLTYLNIPSLLEKKTFTPTVRPTEKITAEYSGEYKIKFDVKPDAVTELKEKGNVDVSTTTYDKFNFVLGNSTSNNKNSMLSVAVGYNGILLMTHTAQGLISESSAVSLGTYNVSVRKPNGTYVDTVTGETKTKYVTTTEPHNIQITNYKKAQISRISNNKIQLVLSERKDTNLPSSKVIEFTVSGSNNLFAKLNETIPQYISNPTATDYVYYTAEGAVRGTKIKYTIKFTATTISIKASQTVSQERIILSYPMSIKDYINIEIEIKKNNAGKYTAKLFVDGEKMEESVEMDDVPRIDSVGMTYIGTYQKYFVGSVKNIKIYN